ncbi:substrate-binding domain-containing protein [Rhizobium leguminosarum]|uniref:sugar ABC transporter substrate-binding protein n=2 Tax=Rhizobium ruizarguesonis TaxID=2081791 RepID=UPI0013B75836|nr:sugar ABC transporter substrate-binding protein [Rhizobium ruizarguesonis]NEJ16614.1 substrate-binding domain-containing protein [Rhizobium ruizarguesonis]NEK30566.1 substrate-binding domain-containing protein [Rhizobium ruizarguesonis]
MNNRVLKAALLAGLAVSATLGFAGTALADGEKYVLIHHSPDSETFWNTVKNGASLAAKEVGATVTFRNPPTGDLADMVRIIQQTTAEKPDGIIVTIPDVETVGGAIEDAVAKGIPVVTMNTGTAEESKKLGALLHVGQPEFDAGKGAGERAKAAGITSFLCVNSLFPNVAGQQRCEGFAAGLGVPLGGQMIDSGTDATEIANRVKAYLSNHADTGAVLTLGPMTALPTIKALKDTGLAGTIFFATFDLTPEISQAIKDGVINFAIDQQPFLQGYLPVITLTNDLRYGVLQANSVLSGPGFVTKDNLALVQSLAGKYR